MDLRGVIRRIAPPILLDIYRALRPMPTWTGVYPNIHDVPGTDVTGRGKEWRNAAVDPTTYTSLPAELLQEHTFLAIAAAILRRENRGTLSILDIGGGLGISYVHLLNTLTESETSRLDYHVVELEWACAEGSRLFAHDPRVHFHRSLPEHLPDLDLVHLTEALEYIDDYAALLRRVCAYRPRYVMLVGLHAGAFATFATAEVNIPGAVIPQWFLNLDEITGIMRTGGYPLIFDGAVDTCVDQRNFPEELRLPGGRPRVLLFARSPDGP